VSLNELYDYVFDRVRAGNPNQTPTRDIEMQGELYLARSTRRRVEPAPLPPDLQAALDDVNAYTRLGAVAELRSRLLSGNLPVAAGARAALARVAEADTRLVAESAAEALAQLRLSVTPSQLSFGPLPPGTSSPPQRVETAGPPLARAATATSAQDWIRVSAVDAGYEVVVVAPGPGRAHGTVTLTAAGVTVAVPVTVEGAAQGAAPDAESAGSPAAPDAGSAGSPVPKPPVEEPAPPQPASDRPAADRPAADRPAADRPASDQPASHQPASAQPVPAEVPVGATSAIGWLSLVVAVPLAVAVVIGGVSSQDWLSLLYLLPLAALATAGLLLVLHRAALFGLGCVAAAGTAATLPAVVLACYVGYDVDGDRTAWSIVLAALVLCVAIGVAAALVARRIRGVRLHPTALATRPRLLVTALAFIGAAALFLNAVRFTLHDDDSSAWFRLPFFWYAVPALVLPLVVAFAVPAGVRDGLRLGWLAAAVPFHVLFIAGAVMIPVGFTYAGLIAYAVVLPVLAAATFWRPAPAGSTPDVRRDASAPPNPG
jgi:hypothetical protein